MLDAYSTKYKTKLRKKYSGNRGEARQYERGIYALLDCVCGVYFQTSVSGAIIR